MKVYSKPNSNQKQEKKFQEYILKSSAEIQHINETYTLSEDEFLNPFIEIRKIEKLLHNENLLSIKKKNSVLEILKQLPDYLRVAENNKSVSVDFLIIDQNKTKHYIEFHEKQHRQLSVSGITPIFDKEYNRLEIPRYVQRYLKDIWRYENLLNYKIVWYDWFSINLNYNISEIINSNKKEFSKDGKFNFTSMYNKNIT